MSTFLISMPGGSEWIIILVIVFIPYFIPSIIAFNRKHPSASAIFALNLLLGWTFIGWIASLIWALSSNSTPGIIVNNNNNNNNAYPQVDAKQRTQPESTGGQTATSQNKLDQLRQLKQLLDEGVLTMEEFNKQKASILG